MTARFRTQRKDRRNSQLAPGTRHNDSTTPCSAETSDLFAASDDSAETRDRMAQVEDLALARSRRQTAHADRSRRTQDDIDRLPQVDRSSLVAQESRGVQGGSPPTGRSCGVDVHPSLRGQLDRLRFALLGRLADGPDVPRGVRRRVLAALRNRRPLASRDSDPRRSTSAGRVQAVGSSRLHAVAEHCEDLRTPLTGPARVW